MWSVTEDSVKDKANLYFWLNKVIWKSQSYSRAEAATWKCEHAMASKHKDIQEALMAHYEQESYRAIFA